MADFNYSSYSQFASGGMNGHGNGNGNGVGMNFDSASNMNSNSNFINVHQRNVSNSTQSPSVRRSQQLIHDYVTKQKEKKQNAEQIRKDRQRAAEHRNAPKMSANDPIASAAAHTDRNRQHYSTYEEDINFAAPNNSYDPTEPRMNIQQRETRPTQSAAVNGRTMHKSSSQSYVPAIANSNPSSSNVGSVGIRSSASSHPHSAGHRHTNANPSLPLPSQAFSNRSQRSESSSTSAAASSAGGCNCVCAEHGDLSQKVSVLEDQIRLLRHQNKIFLSFMQATEHQLNALRAQQTPTNVNGIALSSASSTSSSSAVTASGSAAPSVIAKPSTRPSSSALQLSNSSSLNAGNGKNQKSGQNAQSDRLTDRRREEVKRVDDEHDDEKATHRSGSYSDDYLNNGSKPTIANARQPAQSHRQQQPTSVHQQPSTQPRNGLVNGVQAKVSVSASASAVPAANQPLRAGFQSSALQSGQEDDAEAEADYGDDAYEDGDGDGMDIPENADVELFSCPDCGRRFHESALQRHISKRLCKQKQRKVFDIRKKRVDAAQLQGVKPISQSSSTADRGTRPTGKIPKWKLEHMRFQDALKEGKRLSQALKDGVDIRTLPPPKPSYAQYPNSAGIDGGVPDHQADDRTPCPHCGRKFDEEVAKRHIPKCKDIINKPRGPMSSGALPRQGSISATKPQRR